MISMMFRPKITNLCTIQATNKVNLQEVCLCFGARGLISIDYAIKIIVKLNSNLKRLLWLEQFMSNTLDNTGELRIGAEYKIEN
jgi:hypothetical protein